MHDAFFVLDGDWRFEYVNGEAERALGSKRDGLLHRNIWHQFPDLAASPFRHEFCHAVRTRGAVSFEAYCPPARSWFAVTVYTTGECLCVHMRDINAERRARERTDQLLRVSVDLGNALTTQEVAAVILDAASAILGADTGVLVLLSEDERSLRLELAVGHDDSLTDVWRHVSLDASVPIADAVRERSLVILPSEEARAASYPDLPHEWRLPISGALVAMPLMIGERCIGGLRLTCPAEHCQDGEERTFLWTLAGQCALALERARLHEVSLHQVEGRRLAEEGRRASERLAQSTLDALLAEIAILDGGGEILAVNRAWRRFSEENCAVPSACCVSVGVNYLALCDATTGPGSEDAHAAAAGIRAVAAGERDLFMLEYPCHSPHERRWYSLRVTPFHDEGPARVVVSHENVTERRLAEEALRASEAGLRRAGEDLAVSNITLERSNSFLRAQQDATNDGMLIVDETRRVVSCNRRYREMWAIPESFGVGGSNVIYLSHLLKQIKRPEEYKAHVEDLYQNPAQSGQHELQLKDGRVFDLRSGPVIGEDGNNYGRVWHFRDVTERRLLEAHLAQAQKLESIGQLAAGIAHELNTPIQYVGDNTRFLQNSFADLDSVLRAHGELVDAVRAGADPGSALAAATAASAAADLDYLMTEIPLALTQSLDGVERVAGIVRAMKEFSHPGTVGKTAVDLNRAVESTLTVARNEWKYVADLVLDLDPSLPPVPCLPGELNQVFLNVLVNASHAIADVVGKTGGKGRITVTTRVAPPDAPTHAEVSFTDNGTGIEPGICAKIFDPFFTTKGVGCGTGQGLAISRAIVVDKHGGSITCESQVGVGSTFMIRLPLGE